MKSTGPLVRAVLLITAMGMAAACRTAPAVKNEMTVAEARQLALEFQGKYEAPPPRGFGAYVQLYVDRYITLKPGVLQQCSKTRQRMSQEEIRAIARSPRGYFILNRAAEEAFLDGSIAVAVRLADAVPEATDKSSHIAMAMANKAFFLAQGGDPDAAQSALTDAWYHYGQLRRGGYGGKDDYWAEIVRYKLARAEGAFALAEGDLDQAELEYYQALKHFDRVFELNTGAGAFELPRWHIAVAKAELARTMRLQGRLNEAEIWARDAVMEDDFRLKPLALLYLSEIYFSRQEFDMARQLALAARNFTIDRCVSAEAISRARTRAVYAQTLMALERWDAAVAEFDMIEKEMRADPAAFASSYRDDSDWGLAMIMAGTPGKARVQLERAAQRAARRYGGSHYNTREAQALTGVALSAAGETMAARRRLDSTVPQLLAQWHAAAADNTGDAFRKFKLRLIVETYVGLLTADGDAHRIENAFAMAGMLQAQSVGRAMAASAVRASVSDPVLADLIRRRQDLQARADTFQNKITRSAQQVEGAGATVVTDKLKADLAALNGAIVALDEEIRTRFPRYAAIINPGAVDISGVREHMKRHEAIVAFFVGTGKTFVWAFGQTGPVAFAAVPKGRSALAEDITRLRAALDPPGVRRLDDIPDFDVAAGHDLYQALLAPVADGWRSSTVLMVIPDGPLGQLPLTVLPTARAPLPPAAGALFSNYRGIPWLGRDKAVTLLPSVSALATLRTLTEGSSRRRALAAFGDPVFTAAQAAEQKAGGTAMMASRGGFSRRGIRVAEKSHLDDAQLDAVNLSMLQPLPDTADEVMGIAAALGADRTADVFLGEQASEGRVKGMPLNDRRVVVFATHGLVPGDLDGLREPALALSAPAVTREADTDGLLAMGEVMGLSLDADWVVLSACNTAAAGGAGAEAISGLGQAFFYAGARSLLVTEWPVETTSARALTTDLFKRQTAHPSMSRAEALKQTMIAIMDGPGGNGFTYAHPLFWAAFVLVGDGN